MYEKSAGKKLHIRREDILLAAALVILALVLFAVSMIGRKDGGVLFISQDSEVIERVPLGGDKLASGELSEEGQTRYGLLLYGEEGVSCQWSLDMPDLPVGSSYNLLSVSDGVVRMEAADCPDQICVHHRPVSGGGESIICLPHKLVVEIRGETEEAGLDGMVK